MVLPQHFSEKVKRNRAAAALQKVDILLLNKSDFCIKSTPNLSLEIKYWQQPQILSYRSCNLVERGIKQMSRFRNGVRRPRGQQKETYPGCVDGSPACQSNVRFVGEFIHISAAYPDLHGGRIQTKRRSVCAKREQTAAGTAPPFQQTRGSHFNAQTVRENNTNTLIKLISTIP